MPLIHNVMATDIVVGGQRPGDGQPPGPLQHGRRTRATSASRWASPTTSSTALGSFGLSSHLQRRSAAIKVREVYGLGPETSSSRWRPTAPRCTAASGRISARDHFAGGSMRSPRPRSSASTCSVRRPATCSSAGAEDRERIFNLGYFTWVEQQGVSLEEFEARREPGLLGRGARQSPDVWDELIDEPSTPRTARRSPRDPPAGRDRGRDRERRDASRSPAASCAAAAGRGADGAVSVPLPAARPGDDIDHVLRRCLDPGTRVPRAGRAASPLLVRYRAPAPRLASRPRPPAWSDGRFVRARPRARRRRSARWTGHGFGVTPFGRSAGLRRARLSAAAGRRLGEGRDGQRLRLAQGPPPLRRSAPPRGGHRRGSAGSDPRPPLAIASCGNAALAAAVVARAAGRRAATSSCPDASRPVVLARLARARCAGRPSATAQPGLAGDPAYHALRARRVAGGAVPFTVPGQPQRSRHRGRRDARLGARSTAPRAVAGPRPARRPGRRRRAREACSRPARTRSPSGASTGCPASTPSRPRARYPLARAHRARRRPPARARVPSPDGCDAAVREVADAPLRVHVALGDGARRASPTASSTTRHTTGSRRAGHAAQRRPLRASWTRARSSRRTRSPCPSPASMPTTPAPPASPACIALARHGLVDPDETVAVIFSGVRRSPAAPAPQAAQALHPAHGRNETP